MIEYILMVTILARVTMLAKLQRAFHEVGGSFRKSNMIILHYIMIILGLFDAALFWINPAATFRIAPYVRFGLAASLPWVQALLYSFWKVLVAISKVGAFLLGTVVIFAWVTAMIFDDFTEVNRYGDPVNTGFESFGNALYTSFAAMTTAILPDVIIPSFIYSRFFLLLWLPFLVLACCTFTQVMLATVYSTYQDHTTEIVQEGCRKREHGIKAAFDFVKEEAPHETKGATVRFDAFAQVASALKSFRSGLKADADFLHMVYRALDDNSDGYLTKHEFSDMCDMLQINFAVTNCHSCVRRRSEGTVVGRTLERLMDNKDGSGHGYGARFSGSVFDRFMNVMLAVNVVWMILQSCYDLNDITEPDFFSSIDLFFSFVYLLEVGLKLCNWSWNEYWIDNDNRFDFATTMILAGSGTAFLCQRVDSNIIRYLNLLRLVRLLKALNNVKAYREVFSVIARMMSTCTDVLCMNFLVIYLWSSAGVQLFGGRLYESNPRLEGQDLGYFSSHYQVYNFNDMPSSMVTLFFNTLGTWNDPIATACMALADHFTLFWLLSCAFLGSFYISSPLLAFNVFTAFSIDVFCTIQSMDESAKDGGDEVGNNLSKVKEQLAEKGLCLHVSESSSLKRAKVYKKIYGVPTEDEDAEEKPDSAQSEGQTA